MSNLSAKNSITLIKDHKKNKTSSPKRLPTRGYPDGPGGKGGCDALRTTKPSRHEASTTSKTNTVVMACSDEELKMKIQGFLYLLSSHEPA